MSDIRANMYEKRVNRAIQREIDKGWSIEGVKTGYYTDYTIIAPNGNCYSVDGIFIDDGSVFKYEEKEPESRREYDHAERLLGLMMDSYKYKKADYRTPLKWKKTSS